MHPSSTLNIPQNYLCPVSQKIMSEPVLIVQTGEIMDYTSVNSFIFQNENLIQLNDLKLGIQTYLQNEEEQENQTGEGALDEEFECQIQDNPQKFNYNDLLQIAANYQEQVDLIKSQDFTVQQSQRQLMQIRDEFILVFREFQDEVELFVQMWEGIKKLNLYSPAQIVYEARSQLVGLKQTFCYLMDKFGYMLLRVFVRRKAFEKNLVKLEVEERNLKGVRQDLQNALDQLHVVSTFSTEYNELSEKYKYFYDINEAQFDMLIGSGNVSHVNVDLQSTGEYKTIEVTKQLRLKTVKITAAASSQNHNVKQFKTLKFVLRDRSANIILEDCSFEGIGVSIYGYVFEEQIYGNVRFNNVNINNAPGIGLSVSSCKNFKIEESFLSGCAEGSGISVHNISNACIMKHVEVQNCGYNGIYLMDSDARLENCSVKNCKRYGVFVQSDNLIQTENVELINNGAGRFKGRFVVCN